jgi:PAS domain S-box-containing protein
MAWPNEKKPVNKLQALLASIVESSEDAIVAKQLDGTILSWNSGAVRLFGYSLDEVIGRHVSLLIPDELRSDEEVISAHVATGKSVRHFETFRLCRDGNQVNVSVAVSPIKDQEGKVVGISEAARNITGQKEIEDEIHLEKARKLVAATGLSLGIWELNPTTNRISYSHVFKEIVGMDDATTSASDFSEFESRLHPEDREQTLAILNAHLQRRSNYDVEYRLRSVDGKYVWIHCTGQATWDASGKPLRIVGSSEDITERKRAQIKLKAIVDSAIDGIITTDAPGKVESFNPACERIFGYASEEVLGHNVKTLMPEAYQGEHGDAPFGPTVIGEANVIRTPRREVTGKRKDGTIFPMELSESAFELEDGWHFSSIVRDITARKTAEQEIRNSAMRFKQVIDSAPDGLVTMNGESVIQSFNTAAERIFGFGSNEAVGSDASILMPEPIRSTHDVGVRNYLKTGESRVIGISRDVTGQRKDGSSVILDLSMSVFKVDDKTEFVAIFRDVSARKQLEADSSLLLTSIVASSDDAIISKTLNGLLTSWNISAERMFGYTSSEVIGKHVSIIVPPARLEEEKNILERLNNGEAVQHLESLRMDRNGHLIEVSLSASPVRNAAGRLIGASNVIRNISERKKAEAELARYTSALERSNLELEEFAYAASHDLKAPLRVVSNAIQWLEEDLREHHTDETRDNMKLIRSRVRRMERLLDDLLEYSRIGRKTDERYKEVLAGNKLLEDVLELLDPPQDFTISACSALSSIRVNRMPLQQVLMNLVGNALKHHDKKSGVVEVSVEVGETQFLFAVKDDGPGIPAQFQEQVFKMFHTLKPRDQVEGSGMGLALVRKCVESVGEKIWLESTEGLGCRFCFTWPRTQERHGDKK